MFQIEVEWE